MTEQDNQVIDTVGQSKAKGIQLCADTIMMMNRERRDSGEPDLSQRAEDELRVIMLGKLCARYWAKDVEDAKQQGGAL